MLKIYSHVDTESIKEHHDVLHTHNPSLPDRIIPEHPLNLQLW